MLFVLQIVLPPLGAHPKTWQMYQSNVNMERKEFTCFDGSKVIPLASFNDGVVDCADGSDEPSTGAVPNTTFYCPNRMIQPLKLTWDKVGDGVCDCCDGSDEAQNPNVECPENCSLFEYQRHDFASTLMARRRRGIRMRGVMERRAKDVLSSAKSLAWRAQKQRSVWKWLVSFVDLKFEKFSFREMEDDLITRVWKATFRPMPERPPLWISMKNAAVHDLVDWDEKIRGDEEYTKFMDDIRELYPGAAMYYGKKCEIRDQPWTLFFGTKLKSENGTFGYYERIDEGVVYYTGEDVNCPMQRKSVELRLACNDVLKLTSIQAETPCLYKGCLTAPFVCNASDNEPLYGLRLNKLRQAMCDVGLLRCHS